MKNKKLLTVLVALVLTVATVCTAVVSMGSGSNVEVNMSNHGGDYVLSTLPAGLADGDTLVVICDGNYGTDTPGAFVVTDGAPNLDAIKFVVGDVTVTAGLDLVNTALDSASIPVTGLGMFVEVETDPDLSATEEKLLGSYKSYVVAVGAACANVNETEVNSGKTVKFDVKAAMPAGVQAVVYDEDMNVVSSTYAGGVVSFEGKLGAGYVVMPEFVAVVNGVGYVSVDAALEAGKGSLETPVAIIGEGSYTLSTNEMVVVGVVSDNATITIADDCFSYKTTVNYDGEEYTAYALYNKDFLINDVVAAINDSSDSVGYSASYENGEIVLSAVVNKANAKELIDIVTFDKIKEIIISIVPAILLSDEVALNGNTVYDGYVHYDAIQAFVADAAPTMKEFAKQNTKTLAEFTLSLTSGENTFDIPVTIKLDIPDKVFAELKDFAAKVAKYVDVSYNKTTNTLKVFVDATDLYDYALASKYLSKYTTKELRDLMNGTTIYDVVAKAETITLPSKFARFQDEYDKALEVVNTLLEKAEGTAIKPYLSFVLGLLDMDNDGVYSDARSATVNVARFVARAKKFVENRFPTVAYVANVDAFDAIGTVTAGYDVSIAVHDQFTATFVDENGAVLYETTILEGEVPEYKGKTPYKAGYDFEGWTDGTDVYADELPALLADTTYSPVFEEIPCDHANKIVIDYVAPDCLNPGNEAGWICPDCGATFGMEPIDALGHDWSDWYEVTPAQPGVPGVEERVCNRCGEVETRDIPALPEVTPTPTPTPDTPVVPTPTPTPTPDTPVVPTPTPTETPDTPVVPTPTPTETPDTPVVPTPTPTETPDTPVVPTPTPTETPDTPVVTPTPTPDKPQTGDSTVIYFVIGGMALVGAAVVVLTIKKRKASL